MSEFIRPQVQVEEINENVCSCSPSSRSSVVTAIRWATPSSRSALLARGCRRRGYSDRWCTARVHDQPGRHGRGCHRHRPECQGSCLQGSGRPTRRPPPFRSTAPARSPVPDFFIPSEFELVNPEQHIATLTEGGHLTMSMRIGYGRGYVPARPTSATTIPSV